MRYCKKCVQPDIRPGIFLDENGICSGCAGYEEKAKKIDWKQRKKELERILSRFRSKDDSYYDCIIPVSGGKDSTYQVYTMKKVLNMHPLTVTYKYSDRTELGRENLDNLRRLGVDHLDFAPNPEVEKKFIKKALIRTGDPCLPDHMGIYAVALRTSVNYNVPLIIWGENPELEYGGSAADRNNPFLDRKWLLQHGCLQGSMAEHWIDGDLTISDMFIYSFPSDKELISARISSIFLGYYLPWDPVQNYEIAKKVGFKKLPNGPKMGLYDFADVDSTNMVVHHYIKWLKFGMTRMHDHISIEIRNGRMSREEGVGILKSREERVPVEEIRELCRQLEMEESEFWNILEKFRNRDIWKKDENAKWYIPNHLEGLE
ncbi:MAG: N-acetyl sugar amidotransferase [Candidatus Omnitrophica bacterium]|nr:N-acetyl sugar amidotransferase [Candidatus Omnitrophota bacterium]